MYLSFFATKQVVLFIEAAPVSTPCCLPSLLATVNQMSRLGEAQRVSSVYRRKAVYMNTIHGKTIQWETRKKYYSIIKLVYLYLTYTCECM